MDREEFIERATTKPDGLTLHSGSTLFDELGSTGISQSRDSEPLTKVNFEVITEDLMSRFPEAFEIHRFDHWACGWGETLFVRMDNDEAIDAVLEWHARIENYPVANEEKLSEVEEEIKVEAWADYLADEAISAICAAVDDPELAAELKEYVKQEVTAKRLRKEFLNFGGQEEVERYSVLINREQLKEFAEYMSDQYVAQMKNQFTR